MLGRADRPRLEQKRRKGSGSCTVEYGESSGSGEKRGENVLE